MTLSLNNKDALELGAKMADGSVYAGEAGDGRLIFAMPKDLSVAMTFSDASKAVKKLNANKSQNLGHDDWQVSDFDALTVLQKNQNEGVLKGTFNTTYQNSGSVISVIPHWYWSSTEGPAYSSYMYTVRFSDGFQSWHLRDNLRLSCRPVRLVAASGVSGDRCCHPAHPTTQ